PRRALEQGVKPGPVVLRVAIAVVIVDTDQEGYEVVRAAGRRVGSRQLIERRRQLVGGPAGGGDDPRRLDRHAARGEEPGQLHRPALGGWNGLADRVAVAQRQEPEAHAE